MVKGHVLERRNEVVVCPHLNVSPLRKLFLIVYAIDMRRYMMSHSAKNAPYSASTVGSGS